jgi:hypothetical protein
MNLKYLFYGAIVANLLHFKIECRQNGSYKLTHHNQIENEIRRLHGLFCLKSENLKRISQEAELTPEPENQSLIEVYNKAAKNLSNIHKQIKWLRKRVKKLE